MIVKFKEIADYVAGQSPESKYYSNTEGIPFLQGNRTFGLFYPTIDTYTKK
jgi:type I restriction enzyme S subunit